MVSSVEQFSIVALPLTCIQERAKSNAGCVRAGSEDERMFQAWSFISIMDVVKKGDTSGIGNW